MPGAGVGGRSRQSTEGLWGREAILQNTTIFIQTHTKYDTKKALSHKLWTRVPLWEGKLTGAG